MIKLKLDGPRVRIDLRDPELSLTEAQAEAMATDRELLVSAGAGAGKTRTLALRYVALLLEIAQDAVRSDPGQPRPDIEAVLVVTFTEKAAEEMAARCYQRLLEVSAAVRKAQEALIARHDRAFARGLSAALDHLVDSFSLARISTFHAFCTRLLREFPAETSTAPGFEVLDQARANRLLSEACEQAFQELAAGDADELAILLDAFGSRWALVDGVAQALRERGVIQRRLRQHVKGEVDETWLISRAALSPEQVRRWLHAVGKPVLDELVRHLWPVLDHLAWAKSVHIVTLNARLSELPEDPLELNELYAEVLESVMTGSGRSRGVRSGNSAQTVGSKGLWPDPTRYRAAKDAVADLLASLREDWPERLIQARRLPTRADRTLLEVLAALGKLVSRAEQLLRAELHERGAIDFAGLQHRAAKAIAERPGLLEQLRRRHRYIMVDEFQDTDEVQWSIVRALGRPGGPEKPADRIFLVGDTKQAIYGFRGGDVTVFSKAQAELGVTPLVFPENFRSHPRLIRWFNELFAKVLGAPSPTRPAFEAHYEPLRPGVPDRDQEPGGSVVLLTHEGGGGGDGAEIEAKVTARWIAGHVLKGESPYAELAAMDRDLHPTPPIAILIRARTHLARWESALREQGIPYVVAGGVGFWRRPEVMDLVNGLDAIATHERASVVGLLRSPLFGLADQDIQDLHQLSLLDGFHFRELPQTASPQVRRAQARFRRLCQLRDRLPPGALLEELLADCAAWHLYGLDDDAGQAEGNARRLIELATDLDAQGADGIEEIARNLVEQVRAGERESEASVAPGAARVVIMTVHQSKGLEFPVVVVPQLSSSPIPINDDLIIRRLEGRWDIATRVPDRHAAVQRRTRPGLYDDLAEVRRAEELAEIKRLLYVAVTRAEEHVVLVGTPPKRSGATPSTWMEMLQQHHGAPPTADAHLDVLEGEPLLEREVPRWIQPVEPPAPGPDAARRAHPLPDRFEIEISPSGLDLYEACPARWYRRHLLGVSEHVNRRQVREEALAAARGEVIHSLLEDELADNEDVARARWEARAHAEGCEVDEVERLLPRLLDHLRVSAADPWLRDVLESPGWAEVPFRIAYEELILRGKIDRVWRPSEDSWGVLDYKSEALDAAPELVARRHERQLLCYAWAASRILGARGQGQVRDARVYFTERAAQVPLGPFTDEAFAGFEALLDEIIALTRQSWGEVEEQVTQGPTARPCRDCGFFTRGCQGWRDPSTSASS
ncbi:MAG: UvrD-helicase domain-containing protein [Alphaproteobacteria bacterium]|nr:UvrD-helicase domain-containing protein [Alphaproteobacteria bacterium]MCB9791795.1 UvrD-helicase domain-containing protein [Alphaproteobacteria bacterium]